MHDRLQTRRPEIEAAALTRVKAIADPDLASDPAYAEGLRTAVAAALDYGLTAIGRGDTDALQPPLSLLAQARMAARNRIPLDTVLRRYFAGYSLLGYYMIEEASRDGLMRGAELQRLLGDQSVLLDQLLATIGDEHGRECEALDDSTSERYSARIERLLGGELIDTAAIAYDFDGWHLGLIARSEDGTTDAMRALAPALDLRLLLVERVAHGSVWAWLGKRGPVDPADVVRVLGATPASSSFAVGEPGRGVGGWRLTHRQALAALPIAERRGEAAVRYADVALLAATIKDDVLEPSLRSLYLEPLQQDRDGGEAARETLCAYFATGRNITSTAALLGVKRHTVTNRLRVIENTIGRSLNTCSAELETAVKLDALQR